jgi:hypothetical protein
VPNSPEEHPKVAALCHLLARVLPIEPVELPRAEDLVPMVARRPRLLLDHYDEASLLERLEQYGVLPRLRERGYGEVRVEIDSRDRTREVVRLEAQATAATQATGGWHLVGEAHLCAGEFSIERDFAPLLAGVPLRLLFIQWLKLQDPLRSFTAARPALPGQKCPGLRVGKEIMGMFVALAEKLGLDGILNIPEFGHNAVLYSAKFRFLRPEMEGTLEALRRDLATLSLARASWAVALGCVVDQTTGRPYQWPQEEQILPVSDRLAAHFESPAYGSAVAATRERARFWFDEARLERLCPYDEEGRPLVEL